MNNEIRKKLAQDKYLNAWVPPDGAGEPIGCLATSYTFNPIFFEEECLSRFLQMECDATQDGPVYLIEREERLAGLRCAAAIVDSSHCRGTRNLRWDLLPARIPGAILHAKIVLLQWTSCIRLIIGSGNLTEDGYRRNQEIFGYLDYKDGSDSPLECLDKMVDLLKTIVSLTGIDGDGTSPVTSRCLDLLDGIVDVSRDWGRAEPYRGRGRTRVFAIATGPQLPSVFEQLKSHWPEGTAPVEAIVTSPFFDDPGSDNKPAQQLWATLRKKGPATVNFNLIAEDLEGENAVLLHAPKEIVVAQPKGRAAVKTIIRRVTTGPGDKTTSFRPLHMKSIVFYGGDWMGHIIGSSNFTSAGLGISNRPNLEANLLYLVSISANKTAFKRMERSLLIGDELDKDVKVYWQQSPQDNEDTPKETDISLPPAFGQAIYRRERDRVLVELSFIGNPPSGWFISTEQDEPFLNEMEWIERGRPKRLSMPWPGERPPSGFNVEWHNSHGSAWWPVNVDRPSSLPPPQELKDLPLDILIDILTSARPLHQVLQSWINSGRSYKVHPVDPEIDPHKKVDTSAFLLQKTRRISWALTALRERIERPAASLDALLWRLYGPVGVFALAGAIQREAKSNEERAFLLTELALELGRARPRSAPGHIGKEEMLRAIREAIQTIKKEAEEAIAGSQNGMAQYMAKAFDEVMP